MMHLGGSVFYALYAGAVAMRDYGWTDAGKVGSYAILAVRPATPEEVKQWMEGTR
jgi:hypothetical protein